MEFTVTPIGYVRASRTETIDDAWDAIASRIELDSAQFSDSSLAGLDAFSHVEILFLFDQVKEESIVTEARHPRGRADWPKVGIFAQRGKARPNRIGATICRLVSVKDLTIEISGFDAVDGTPVLDIKPVMTGFLPRGEVKEPLWSQEIMAEYW